jgi:hypothetical protein
MKHMTSAVLAPFVLAGLLVTLAGGQSQSLGDYARSVRKEEKKAPTKQYDNDNLPTTDKISIVGNATEPPDAQASSRESSSEATPGQGAGSSTTPEAQPQDTTKKADSADPQKANDEWKQKLTDQKSKVDLLARELDVAQREYRLRAAAFYADAGNRLRNQGSWDKEDAQYKKDLAQKQRALDDAKKGLDDMREQARKAGMPARVRE